TRKQRRPHSRSRGVTHWRPMTARSDALCPSVPAPYFSAPPSRSSGHGRSAVPFRTSSFARGSSGCRIERPIALDEAICSGIGGTSWSEDDEECERRTRLLPLLPVVERCLLRAGASGVGAAGDEDVAGLDQLIGEDLGVHGAGIGVGD